MTELAAEVAEVAGWGPFFAVQLHDPGTPPVAPWRSMAALTEDPDVLRDRVSAVRDYLAAGAGGDVEQRVAASTVQLGLVARLVSPAIALAALGGRVLALGLPGARWQSELGGAFPLSLPGATPESLATVVLAVVRPIIVATQRFSVSERVLWGNVASAINGAATMIGAARPDLASRADTVASGLLDLPPLRGNSVRDGDGRFRRRSCCLIYRVAPAARPRAVCGDCVLT